jgi:hypothetical protein
MVRHPPDAEEVIGGGQQLAISAVQTLAGEDFLGHPTQGTIAQSESFDASSHISPGFVARLARCRTSRARSAYLRYEEHSEARIHRWSRCIVGRSIKLVRYAG